MDAPRTEGSGTRGSATEPLLLTTEQAATSLAICRTKVYELLRNGELESVQIGASRRIPAAALVEYVRRLRGHARVSAGAWEGSLSTLPPRRPGC